MNRSYGGFRRYYLPQIYNPPILFPFTAPITTINLTQDITDDANNEVEVLELINGYLLNVIGNG